MGCYEEVIINCSLLTGIEVSSDFIQISSKVSSIFQNWDAQKTVINELNESLQDPQNLNLGRKELNQILLLIGADPVSEDFFKMVFGEKITTLNDFKDRINHFRQKAALRFGNFKYAFRYFAGVVTPKASLELGLNESPLKTWENLKVSEEQLVTSFRKRVPSPIKIKPINISDRYFVSELNRIDDKSNPLYTKSKEVREIAKYNSVTYLTSDYIDVYVATSMRKKGQFEDVGGRIDKIFNSCKLRDLNIRYFDPTLSDCQNRLSKGLIEALMLKRAKVTLYLAQESDSLGKDSELANTLAQGKDVIIFVPSYDQTMREEEIDKIFLSTSANAEQKQELLDYFRKIAFNMNKHHMVNVIDVNDLSNASITTHDLFKMEEEYYNDRAQLLKDEHPLGLQVNINTGVAHGVIVARSEEVVSTLIYRSLTNSHEYELLDKKDEFQLVEKLTGSVVRFITKDSFLTKTFWANYLDLKRHE